jgi:beta-xylosidase
MGSFMFVLFACACLVLLSSLVASQNSTCATPMLPVISESSNSTYANPILPGFHPDPSCILVPEWDNTFFCASSSFLAFPGIPIHASKDLQSWKLIGNVLNRQEQLPELSNTTGQTSGIWAPSIRYHEGIFYVVTTLVHDDRDQADASRWDNIIFSSKNPYITSWSNATHFKFEGYDTSPFWDDDGTAYIVGSHAYRVQPGIDLMTADLDTGVVGLPTNLWNGTGGLAPEGPHIYRKDGYYYLMIAEGGTGLNHMETIARSKSLTGPYDPNPANPILSNANTTQYFQTVGHADLFQDVSGNWWGVALSSRTGPDFITCPMGRETVLYPVTWAEGAWPVASPVRGTMNGWCLPPKDTNIPGIGPFITSSDALDFAPGSSFPPSFLFWRFPVLEKYTISPPGHPNTVRIKPSSLNLTAFDGRAAPGDQTLLARRQVDTLFTYNVDIEFSPKQREEEAGVTVFLTQGHHVDLGIVLLPSPNATAGSPYAPYFRFRSTSYIPVPTTVVTPVNTTWLGQPIRMEIKAFNLTHYSFSAGPAGHQSAMTTIGYAPGSIITWGFTGRVFDFLETWLCYTYDAV